MKLSEVKKQLLDSLIPISKEYEYKINKSKFALINKDVDKICSLQFTENHWSTEIQIMPAICVDVIEINAIWSKFDDYISYTFFMNLRKLEDWFDIGVIDWEKFKLNDGDKYCIFNYDKDLVSASEDIQRLFRDYGLRYINDYGHVKGVDTLYNNNPLEEDNPHCAGFQVQSVVGIIAAKLAKNPKYDEIKSIYTKRMKKHKEEDTMDVEDIERFFEVSKYLEKNLQTT